MFVAKQKVWFHIEKMITHGNSLKMIGQIHAHDRGNSLNPNSTIFSVFSFFSLFSFQSFTAAVVVM